MACQKRTAALKIPCNHVSKKVYSALFGRFKFLIKRCCWGVMKIYTHYTFEQVRF